MLPREDISRAVEIQKRSYKLFKWLADAIDRGFITFTRAHDYSSASDAAYDWIDEHYLNLPESTRPPREQLREFSNYFGSYVTSSFDIIDEPGTKLESRCGCYCCFCAHLVNASHLRAKKPSKKDKKRAEKERVSRVLSLSIEDDLLVTEEVAASIATAPGFLRDAAYSAYGSNLLKRIHGSEGGVYILALWREIAWKPEGSPIKGFTLEVEDIYDAEEKLVGEIRKRRTRKSSLS